MRTRTFFVVALLASLLVAGGLSHLASSNPDGLEHVAERVGFADTSEDSAAAGSPLSDYQVRGIENDALSGGLAGVVGAVVVLLVAGGLAHLVRRRGAGSAADRSGDGSGTAPAEPGAAEPGAAEPGATGQDPTRTERT